MRLSRVLHAAEPWKDPPLGWEGRLHQGAVGCGEKLYYFPDGSVLKNLPTNIGNTGDQV